jgi:hypothetical protein
MLVKLLLNFKSTILFDLRNVKTVLKSEINQINLCCLAVVVLHLKHHTVGYVVQNADFTP